MRRRMEPSTRKAIACARTLSDASKPFAVMMRCVSSHVSSGPSAFGAARQSSYAQSPRLGR